MRRTLVLVSVFAVASSITTGPLSLAAPAAAKATPAPKKAPAKIRVAPADEYFGKLKLSILGIRNTIKDLGLKADYEPVKAASIIGSAALTEDALRDWQKKYPLDPWIPKTAFALAQLYGKVPTDAGQKLAKETMQWLIARYPNSSVARVGRQELAAGRVGTPVVVPPTPAPDSVGAGGPGSAATASPSPAPGVPNPQSLPTVVPKTTPQPASTIPTRSLGLPNTAPATPGGFPAPGRTQPPSS